MSQIRNSARPTEIWKQSKQMSSIDNEDLFAGSENIFMNSQKAQAGTKRTPSQSNKRNT